MDDALKDKAILVMGGASGIGGGTVKLVAAVRVRIMLADWGVYLSLVLDGRMTAC